MSETTEFFRCMVCSRFYEMKEFLASQKSECKCGGRRFFPARITTFEATIYLATHPAVLFHTLWEKIWRKQK